MNQSQTVKGKNQNAEYQSYHFGLPSLLIAQEFTEVILWNLVVILITYCLENIRNWDPTVSQWPGCKILGTYKVVSWNTRYPVKFNFG